MANENSKMFLQTCNYVYIVFPLVVQDILKLNLRKKKPDLYTSSYQILGGKRKAWSNGKWFMIEEVFH